MGKVVTFGEIMLRLSPEGYNRFVQADRFGFKKVAITKIGKKYLFCKLGKNWFIQYFRSLQEVVGAPKLYCKNYYSN